jgi:DNA-binding NtrC family response regulator
MPGRFNPGFSGCSPAMATKILVVDDEAGMRRSLAIMLRREGYEVLEASGGKEALDQLGEDVLDLVIADLRMTPVSGLDVLRAVKQTTPDVEIILMTGYGTVETAVEAMKLGAFDFIAKPFRHDEILLRVRNAIEKRRLSCECNLLRSEVDSAFGLKGIIGTSAAMRELLKVLPRVAQTDSTVLLTGESGSGKELVARAIIAASRRANRPFVSVNCTALPEQLLENELFGHVKGAFTGAQGARRGLLEEAHTGTFFLDEIGEAPISIQTKLLRVLEERSLRRLGDNRSIPIDVRIIAATNRDLDTAVQEKRFRDDLLYRLNVIRLHLPPLRDRLDDVPLLARHFLSVYCQRLDRRLEGFAPDALATLQRYSYPGNVRELINIIERAVALAPGSRIELSDLPDLLHRPAPRVDTVAETPPLVRTVPEPASGNEQERLLAALRDTNWNVSRAAARLGISRNTIRYRMEKYGLHP